MRTTKRTRTGSSLVVVLVCGVLSAAAGKKPEAYAVIAGTVFREDGFSLPGAVVTVLPKDAPGRKKLEAVSDARGEFAVRVPAGSAAYVVKAAHKGFQPAEKEASVSGEGRVDVTLILSAESK
jgi:hypothetical protein